MLIQNGFTLRYERLAYTLQVGCRFVLEIPEWWMDLRPR